MQWQVDEATIETFTILQVLSNNFSGIGFANTRLHVVYGNYPIFSKNEFLNDFIHILLPTKVIINSRHVQLEHWDLTHVLNPSTS